MPKFCESPQKLDLGKIEVFYAISNSYLRIKRDI